MKGLHLTADLRGVDPGRLLMTDTTALATACGDAVRMAGLSGVAELMPVLFRDYRVRDVSVEEPEIEEVVPRLYRARKSSSETHFLVGRSGRVRDSLQAASPRSTTLFRFSSLPSPIPGDCAITLSRRRGRRTAMRRRPGP